jgi:division protein CdvB (Snf7/Vps24/ESCRT-III family)
MVMDRFEKQFEDLDVQTQTMEAAMASSSATTTPADQVQSLIEQVAVQNGTHVVYVHTQAGALLSPALRNNCRATQAWRKT